MQKGATRKKMTTKGKGWWIYGSVILVMFIVMSYMPTILAKTTAYGNMDIDGTTAMLDENSDVPSNLEYLDCYQMHKAALVLEKGKLSLYRNKEVIATTPWKDGELSYFLLDRVDTRSGNVDYIFVSTNSENPWIKVENPFKDLKGTVLDKYLYNSSLDAFFPVFETDDGLYYSIKPHCNEDFNNYLLQPNPTGNKDLNEVDVSFRLICLNDSFTRIEFIPPQSQLYFGAEESEYRWQAEVCFGPGLLLHEYIKGYDPSVWLGAQDIEDLAKVVYTKEDYNANVEKIRETYMKYYDNYK